MNYTEGKTQRLGILTHWTGPACASYISGLQIDTLASPELMRELGVVLAAIIQDAGGEDVNSRPGWSTHRHCLKKIKIKIEGWQNGSWSKGTHSRVC